jgi:hypothetical protein
MKNLGVMWLICLFTGFTLVSCAGGAGVKDFSEFEEKTWSLISIEGPSVFLYLDRPILEQGGQGEFFTLRFKSGQYNGRAAPNLYRGPYESGAGQRITLKPAAATLMAVLVNIEGITESEYFGYLERTTRWTAEPGMLKLHSAAPDGSPATLVFSE